MFHFATQLKKFTNKWGRGVSHLSTYIVERKNEMSNRQQKYNRKPNHSLAGYKAACNRQCPKCGRKAALSSIKTKSGIKLEEWCRYCDYYRMCGI